MKSLALRLRALGACPEAVAWAKVLNKDWTYQEAWDNCGAPDWLLWLLFKTQKLTTALEASIACLELLIPYNPPYVEKAVVLLRKFIEDPSDKSELIIMRRDLVFLQEYKSHAENRAIIACKELLEIVLGGTLGVDPRDEAALSFWFGLYLEDSLIAYRNHDYSLGWPSESMVAAIRSVHPTAPEWSAPRKKAKSKERPQMILSGD